MCSGGMEGRRIGKELDGREILSSSVALKYTFPAYSSWARICSETLLVFCKYVHGWMGGVGQKGEEGRGEGRAAL